MTSNATHSFDLGWLHGNNLPHFGNNQAPLDVSSTDPSISSADSSISSAPDHGVPGLMKPGYYSNSSIDSSISSAMDNSVPELLKPDNYCDSSTGSSTDSSTDSRVPGSHQPFNSSGSSVLRIRGGGGPLPRKPAAPAKKGSKSSSSSSSGSGSSSDSSEIARGVAINGGGDKRKPIVFPLNPLTSSSGSSQTETPDKKRPAASTQNPKVPLKSCGTSDNPLSLSSSSDDDSQKAKASKQEDSPSDVTPTLERTLAALGGDSRYLDSVRQQLMYNSVESNVPAHRAGGPGYRQDVAAGQDVAVREGTSRDQGNPLLDTTLPYLDTSTVYFPKTMESRIPEMSEEDLKAARWITAELHDQIEQLRPQSSQIGQANNERCPVALEAALAAMFPIGRQFASKAQLGECVTELGNRWCFTTSHSSKKFACTFGRATRGKRPENKNGETLKDQVDCPFFIGYNLIGYSRASRGKNGQPQLRFRCKVTSANYKHECDLDPTSNKVALTISKRSLPHPRDAMEVVRLLRRTPQASNIVLRDVLRECVPSYVSLDAAYLAKVRRSILKFNMLPKQDLGSEDLDYIYRVLHNKRTVDASNEYSEFFADGIMKQNYTEMLRTIMQEGGETWDAIKLLEDAARTTNGFVFRVRRNNDGRPIGILWMTATMRRNAVRFGDILFLDAQKRQMNLSGWPYIALVIKTSEHKIGLIAEGLHVEESIDAYAWSVKTASELEPLFKLDNVRIVYGDEFLTERFLREAGLLFAILCGDYYHLFKVVWPKYFGNDLFQLILPFLRRMFLSKTIEQYLTAYGRLMSLSEVRALPEKVCYLEAINRNRNRYAGYIRQRISGNLGLSGSAPAEQNHSSIVARIGPGGVFSISEYISKLLARQGDLARKEYESAIKHKFHIRHYRSKEVTTEYVDMDVLAFQVLSKYAYKMLFLADFVKHKVHKATPCPSDPNQTLIHPSHIDVTGMTLQEAKANTMIWVISSDGKCNCGKKVAVGMQCYHETVLQKKFDPVKWSKRWYNEHYLESIGENYTVELSESTREVIEPTGLSGLAQQNLTPARDGAQARDGEMPSDNLFSPQDNELGSPPCILGSPLRESDCHGAGNNQRLTYQTVLARQTELSRAIQSDQRAMRVVMHVTEEMLKCVRSKNFSFQLVSQIPPSDSTNRVNRSLMPINASSRPITNPYSIQRKRSIMEGQGSQLGQRKRGRYESDRIHVGTQQKNMSKSCSLCRQQKHQVGNCPKVTKWGVQPIPRNAEAGKRQKQELVGNLGNPTSFPTSRRSEGFAQMDVYDTIPTKNVKGIVIHRRFFLSPGYSNGSDTHRKYCFECSLLGTCGNVVPGHIESLFSQPAITTFLTKAGKGMIIINCMKNAPGDRDPELSQGELQMPSQEELEGTDGKETRGLL